MRLPALRFELRDRRLDLFPEIASSFGVARTFISSLLLVCCLALFVTPIANSLDANDVAHCTELGSVLREHFHGGRFEDARLNLRVTRRRRRIVLELSLYDGVEYVGARKIRLRNCVEAFSFSKTWIDMSLVKFRREQKLAPVAPHESEKSDARGNVVALINADDVSEERRSRSENETMALTLIDLGVSIGTRLNAPFSPGFEWSLAGAAQFDWLRTEVDLSHAYSRSDLTFGYSGEYHLTVGRIGVGVLMPLLWRSWWIVATAGISAGGVFGELTASPVHQTSASAWFAAVDLRIAPQWRSDRWFAGAELRPELTILRPAFEIPHIPFLRRFPLEQLRLSVFAGLVL